MGPPWTLQRIRAHLLLAPPFDACDDDRLWAESRTRRVAVPCPQRPQLIIALARALHRYFDTVDVATGLPSPDRLQQMYQTAVWDALQLLLHYEQLRKSRRLSRTARTHVPALKTKTLRAYERFLLHLRDTLTPDDYATMARDLRPSHHQDSLEVAMLHAFTAYGPPQRRGAFSTMAMYDALARILIHFDIEHRARTTVVDRLRKTVQRTPVLRTSHSRPPSRRPAPTR
jgi:hypothetical protein